jgi:hypothetical protein
MTYMKLGIEGRIQKEIAKQADEEANSATIRRKLLERYNIFFRHWRDYTVFVAVVSMIGLILTIFNWEATFTSDFRLPETAS